MDNWKCPLDDIDEDIRDVVRVLYENGMKPYMSCSGSYKDHKDKKSYSPYSGCIEMLDSPCARELLAVLVEDPRFKCSIAKESARTFYDNQLPEGLRFEIDFENISGNIQRDLLPVVQSVINGKKSKPENRAKIDKVCELLAPFNLNRANNRTH